MVSSINLIPEQEIYEQKKKLAVKVSTILTVLLFVVIAAASTYIYTYTNNLRATNNQLLEDISSLRNDVNSFSEIEIAARNLSKKYTALKQFYDTRVHYSLLFKEINSRKPGAIKLVGLTVRNNTFELSGTAENFSDIQNFVSNLTNKDFAGGEPALKNLFTMVSLTSVNLVESNQTLNFGLSLDVDASLLSVKNRGL